MNSWATLLAASLLITPPNIPESISKEDWPAIQEAIQSLAIEWEIMDPKEQRYIFARFDDFQSDLDILRERYQLLKDAPKLSDHHRFMASEVTKEYLAFNRAYFRFLSQMKDMNTDRPDIVRNIRESLCETESLYKIWDSLKDAKCEYYYIIVRRTALKTLRDKLGNEAYNKGEMPPFVPLWRFREN